MRLRSIIGKRWKAAAAAVFLSLLLFALPQLRAAGKAGQRSAEASEGLNHYDFDLVFRPDQSELAVTMTLDYRNGTGDMLDHLVLRTWAGAYRSEETSPAAIDALYDACYPDGFSPGAIRLEGCWWNGETADAAFADEAQTVLRVSVPSLMPGASGRLLLRCRLTIPECAHRFGHAGNAWQFGNALPILSVYENGSWRADAYSPIGDPFYSECANYDVKLIAPEGYLCAATGSQSAEKRADGTQLIRMKALAVRDFAFALSASWQHARENLHGVRIDAYAPSADGARRAAGDLVRILSVYEKLYGEYAWDTCCVCAVGFPLGGMEYPTLIFADPSYFDKDWADTLELLLAHEAAHQWFYSLVGSDQFGEPWQDEALSEYAMLRYIREKYGRGAYENLRILRVDAPMRERIPERVTPATPIDGFGSYDAYTAVVYGRGAAFLLAADELTGKLDAFLRAYCDQFAFSVASRADFAALLSDCTGEDLGPLMTDYLDTLIL